MSIILENGLWKQKYTDKPADLSHFDLLTYPSNTDLLNID